MLTPVELCIRGRCLRECDRRGPACFFTEKFKSMSQVKRTGKRKLRKILYHFVYIYCVVPSRSRPRCVSIASRAGRRRQVVNWYRRVDREQRSRTGRGIARRGVYVHRREGHAGDGTTTSRFYPENLWCAPCPIGARRCEHA